MNHHLAALLILLSAVCVCRADGPADNNPEKVRRVPALGIEVPEGDRQELTKQLEALKAALGELEKKTDPRTRDIQILMVTALNELGDIEQASECGTDDFVSKPVNKFELLTRVKSLLRVRHLKSELERALTYLNEIEHDEETL